MLGSLQKLSHTSVHPLGCWVALILVDEFSRPTGYSEHHSSCDLNFCPFWDAVCCASRIIFSEQLFPR